MMNTVVAHHSRDMEDGTHSCVVRRSASGCGTSGVPCRTRAWRLMTLLCIAFAASLPGVLPTSARAGDSQLPGGGYPEAKCASPLRPLAGDKIWEWELYRQKMDAYRACVDDYVRRARSDIEIIQSEIDKAVRAYNREVTMP